MLNLRPDPHLGGGERITLHAVGGDTHSTEIVLIQGDGGTGKGKVPGFKTALGKGNIPPDPFGGSLRQIQGSHIQNGLGNVGVFGLDIGAQLAHSRFGDAGNTCVPLNRCAAHSRFHGLSEPIHGVPRAQLVPQVFRITMIGRNTTGATFLVGEDHAVRQGVKVVFLAQHSEQLNSGVIRPGYGGFCGGGFAAGDCAVRCAAAPVFPSLLRRTLRAGLCRRKKVRVNLYIRI